MIQTKYKSQREAVSTIFHWNELQAASTLKGAVMGKDERTALVLFIAVFSNFSFVKKKARNYKRWRKALGKDYFAFLATAFFNSCSLGETKPEIASWQICCN